MKENMKSSQRGQAGYGSSYRKGKMQDLGKGDEIPVILGGQVWMVQPDQKSKSSNPCVWMQAGAVKFKNCNNYYDCTTCSYDAGMGQRVEQGKQISWQDAMRKKSDIERVCRHSLTHRIANRLCAYDYQCGACDFDQFFEDVWTAKSKSIPSALQQIKGFDVPMDYYFHDGHAWARIESGGYIRIGLDDFTSKLFGKADRFELPLMGKELDQGAVGWGLKRKENLADMLSPVGGVIVEVNAKARQNPEVVNREPYGDGWLFLVRTPDIKKSMKDLMTDTKSLTWMDTEVRGLESMIEEVAGPLAADGGHLAGDIFGNLPKLGWRNLTQRFLKTR
ncbi:MAG: glycine cleavage system protein H [Thermodesulfobacteriota bacterium]